MNNFPVKKITADEIVVGGYKLSNQDGDLYFNSKLLTFYEDLMNIHVVSSITDRNLLNPRLGDIVKVTDTSEAFIWNGVWISIQRDTINEHIVSDQTDLEFLNGVVGDVATITNENRMAIYSGTDWVTILTGVAGVIDDNATNTGTTWSSSKIQNTIDTHTADAGNY